MLTEVDIRSLPFVIAQGRPTGCEISSTARTTARRGARRIPGRTSRPYSAARPGSSGTCPTPARPVPPRQSPLRSARSGPVASTTTSPADCAGAQLDTIEILEYTDKTYPNAEQVTIHAMFPTEDAYGNTSNSIVLNVTYNSISDSPGAF